MDEYSLHEPNTKPRNTSIRSFSYSCGVWTYHRVLYTQEGPRAVIPGTDVTILDFYCSS